VNLEALHVLDIPWRKYSSPTYAYSEVYPGRRILDSEDGNCLRPVAQCRHSELLVKLGGGTSIKSNGSINRGDVYFRLQAISAPSDIHILVARDSDCKGIVRNDIAFPWLVMTNRQTCTSYHIEEHASSM
jgi:hypothetical protein